MIKAKSKSTFESVIKARLFFPILCLMLVLAINLLDNPRFFNISFNNGVLFGYVIDVVNRASELVILAVGMTLVVSASSGTDISVGAVMSVSAAVACAILAGGKVSVNEYQNPFLVAIIIALLIGMVCGAFNGFLVSCLKIQPMIATLILFTAGRGIAQLITNGQITYVRVDSYKVLGNYMKNIPIPTPVFVALIVVFIVYIILKKTALGLYIQSVGINSKASKLIGIKSVLIIFLTYVISGLCAGVAGLVASSRIYSADANNIGLNLELDAILAVALGGNSLGGGKFNIIGSVIGAYTIQALTTTLYARGVSADQLPVYKAIVVILIVSIQSEQINKWAKQLKKNIKKSIMNNEKKEA